MAYSVRLRSIYLRNFIGIQTGLGRKELEVNFKKFKDKNIVLIIGDNATGKSTFMSVLHCLPGTTDGRNKFILEGKEGIKKTVYDRSDGCRFECKIIYSPSKTGHNTKGFVTKIEPNGEETELNENGNITSYKEVVQEELGISDAILKLANQNDVCKGHVDMTSTERKLNMSTFLPDDIYSGYYAIVDKQYKELKMRINLLVESIGKMHDEETLNRELKIVTEKINKLVAKRDKCMQKISEYRTRIQVIKETGIEDKNKELMKAIRKNYDDIQKIQDKIESIFDDYNLSKFLTRDSTAEKINTLIAELGEQGKGYEVQLMSLNNSVTELRLRRNLLTQQIESKKNSIADLETSHSLGELIEIRKSYQRQIKSLRESMQDIDPGLTKENLLLGYEIVKNVRTFVDSFGGYYYDLVMVVCNDEYRDYKHDELLVKRRELMDERSDIYSKLATIDSDTDSDNILGKRPENCTIDSCPFIATAFRLKKFQEKIPEYTSRLDEIEKALVQIEDKISKAEQIEEIKNRLGQLMQYINTNISVIKKLPYHEKYSTLEAIKKAISKNGSNLDNCDDFDEFIAILESKEELATLENIELPKVNHEIELLETKGKFIETTKEDLLRLSEEKDLVSSNIESKESEIESISDRIDFVKGIIDALGDFYSKRSEYDSLYDQIVKQDEELKAISSQMEDMREFLELISEKEEKLKEIDDELDPLTRTRELYKMELLKIKDNKVELASVEADMFNCEIVRAALSVKDDGSPVGALEFFMDSVRTNANTLLSSAFNGNLYLEEFVINSKDFIIPYKKNGDRGLDVSYSSSSERSFISLCLTLAIIEEIVNSYTIVCLDEVDRGFAHQAKSKFIQILATQIRRSGIEQLFMISHNYEFYSGYDVGVIAFPGANINGDDSDVIYIERLE